jgi:outer membrane lipoprotein-sorting protein
MKPNRFRQSLLALSILLVISPAQAQDASPAEVAPVVEKVRATYAGLTSWHFEHRIVIEEVGDGPSPTNIADVTFMTANQGPAATAGLNRAMCAGLCRLEWSTAARGRVVLVRDGQTTWLHSTTRNEFVKGQALRDVASSVSGPMLLSVHGLPLTFDEQQWSKIRLLESQTIEVGGERRDCYVLEATLKSQGMQLSAPGSRRAADPFAAFTPSGYFGILSLQALSAIIAPPVAPSTALYFAALSATEFPRALFWIDKESGLVLRRTTTQSARKLKPGALSLADTTPVELRLTDTFTLAKTGSAVPESLFRFDPPAGAKEVSRQ